MNTISRFRRTVPAAAGRTLAPSRRLDVRLLGLRVLFLGLLALGAPVPAWATFAYVSTLFSDEVWVIDTATNAVVDVIPVGDEPLGVAVHPGGGSVYVTNSDESSVSVIDTASNSVATTVNVGSQPTGVAVDPLGAFVYVANLFDDSVSVIDTATNGVITTESVGPGPFSVAFNPVAPFAYVTVDTGLVIIDTTTHKALGAIPVQAAFGSGLAIHPNGIIAYMTSSFQVMVVNLLTGRVTNIFMALPSHVAVHPNGERVYAGGLDGVAVIDARTNTILDLIPTPPASNGGVDVHPNGTRVYVTHDSGTVSVIDTESHLVVATPAVGPAPRAWGKFVGGPPSLPDPCTLQLQLGFDSLTLILGFRLRTLEPADWGVWLWVGGFAFELWTVEVPVIQEPLSVPISFPFPPLGTVGVLSTLSPLGGSPPCTVWKTIDTGRAD